MDININNYLRIDLMDMLLVLISTLIICLIAKKFFWQPALAYLDKRKQLIQDELDDAAKSKQEGEEYKKKYSDQLKNARHEANEILDKARNNAKVEGAQIVEKAQNDARLTLEKAQRDIELEKLSAQKQIRKEITDVAFVAAKQILEKEIDEETQKNYVNEFINEEA
ncbi:MAG: F0F1 ATP synthase subunit B [Traorella sp.]